MEINKAIKIFVINENFWYDKTNLFIEQKNMNTLNKKFYNRTKSTFYKLMVFFYDLL